jgi:4-hydroxybenzoate polyprenyltransferase
VNDYGKTDESPLAQESLARKSDDLGIGNTNDSSRRSTPLVVDLDGTLLRTDTLGEVYFELLRHRPGQALASMFVLARGKAAFKAHLVDHVVPLAKNLPLREDFVEWLRKERGQGREMVLATATDQRIADILAAELGLFDRVLASDGKTNLKSEAKASALVSMFGRQGFDYAGDSRADLPVWEASRQAVVVGSQALWKQASQVALVGNHFHTAAVWPAFLRALRPHQWVKNLLLFLPLLAAHAIDEPGRVAQALLAFVAFSLTASSVYLLNDLLDLPADRQHPRKKDRALASGALPLLPGAAAIPFLLLVAAVVSLLFLPNPFLWVLGLYYLLTNAYSFGLKRKPVVDVLVLAGLYTIRVMAGAAAIAVPLSFWLLAFSLFIFLSLALAKRYTELASLQSRGESNAAGRGWQVNDLPLVRSFGTGSALGCVLILALYIDSAPAQRLYATPELLWLVCPLLLYWICRVWFLAHRGLMHDDPVVFALRDRVSFVLGIAIAAIVLLATSPIVP